MKQLDQLTYQPNDYWATATLSHGRTYMVSLTVRRKQGAPVSADHVVYWSARDGKDFGPIQTATEYSTPDSVAGRIWRLLVDAGIA